MPAYFCRVLISLALFMVGGVPVYSQGLSGAYLAARQASHMRDFREAAQYYTQALARDPSHPVLLEQAALAYLSLGQLDRALAIARKIDADQIESHVANMVLVAELVRAESYDDLVMRLNDQKGVGPLVDGLLLAWAELGRGAMSNAIQEFDTVAKGQGLGGFAQYHKALALASVGDFEAAEAILADNGPNGVQLTRRGAIARVEILSQLNRNEEAVAFLETTFGYDLDPALSDMLERLNAGETLAFSLVQGPQDGAAEVFYSVAGALESEAAPAYTLLYAHIAEFLRPEHVDAILLAASLLEEMERYDLAAAAYKRVPTDHEAFHAAEIGRAETLRKSGKADAAIEVLEQLSRTHPDLPIVYSSLGDIFRQQKDYSAAVEAYSHAVDLSEISSNTRPHWFLHYTLGISYERLDNWEEAEANFRKALELNPDQPQVLNYLGYSLVEKQIKLDEALAMIEKAVSKRSESGYIVDSLGWVLYRLGRYEEAVANMERAVELMPIDPIVNDHLGDVYWAVGRYREAEFQWKRALSFVDEDIAEEADPDRIRQKLEIGLDAVLEEEGAAPLKVADGD